MELHHLTMQTITLLNLRAEDLFLSVSVMSAMLIQQQG